jgi:GAF domain-containing protein
LRARDHLLGVLIVGPRPGEHYAAEERELMAHVAHAVAASLFALRARATEEQLSAARTRESALLDALRALGADTRISRER